jgi:hypothetical protein
MIVVRVIVTVLAIVGVAAVLASMLRTVVLPRAVPARLARAAFLVVHWLLRLRLRLTGRSDYATRDRIFAVQAPLGLFALLALVIAYLPTLYGAFSRREELITKLTVRTGTPPSGPALLSSSWELGRFDLLEPSRNRPSSRGCVT